MKIFLLFLKVFNFQGQVPDQAWEISPYNALAYGALVVVLGWFGFQANSERKAERAGSKQLAEDTIKLVTKVEEKLPSTASIMEIRNLLEGIKNEQSSLRKEVSDISSKIH